MSDYAISQIYPSDKRSLSAIDALLKQEGISRDGNPDYICATEDEKGDIIATGSCFGTTLRCFAVSKEHQGEGLLNEIISHLIEIQYARGNMHLFLYTKINSAKFFKDLGFYEIARVDDTLVFMENRKNGFSDYLDSLEIILIFFNTYDIINKQMSFEDNSPLSQLSKRRCFFAER